MCKSQLEEVAGGTGLGVVGLHMKGTLTGNLLPVSRNELSLGDMVSSQPARSIRRCQNIIKDRKFKTGLMQEPYRLLVRFTINIS